MVQSSFTHKEVRLKDAMMQKVSPVPSCLADSSEANISRPGKAAGSTPSASEGGCRVRLSATSIGLAISIGVTGILLGGQSEAVLAANSAAPGSKLLEMTGESAENPGTTANNKLTSPAIKHEVQQGESLWQISEAYQVSPIAIATTNNINSQADLEIGQSLKIPSTGEAVTAVAPVASPQTLARRSDSLDTPLGNLREARKRLQQSLAALKSEAAPVSANPTARTIEVSDASLVAEPSEAAATTQVTALSPSNSQPQAIEIPVPEPETGRRATNTGSPVPIAIPSPVTAAKPTAPLPAPLPVPQATATAKRSENREVDTPDAAIVPKPEAIAPSQLPHPLPLSPTTAFLPGQPKGSQLPAASREIDAPSNESAGSLYRVRVGDTLNSIARRHGLSVAQLMRINNIANPNLIKVNQPLVVSQPQVRAGANSRVAPLAGLPNTSLPVTTASQRLAESNQGVELPVEPYQENLKADIQQLQETYRGKQPTAMSLAVQPAAPEAKATPESLDSEWASDRLQRTSSERQLPDNAKAMPSAVAAKPQLISAANVNPQEYNSSLQLPVGQTVSPELPPLSPAEQYLPNTPMNFTGYIWPAKGVLTSGFGWRWGRMHKGVDIAAPIGTPVVAAAPGEVISAGWNSGGYGNLVKVQHDDGSITLYAHNSRILVRPGQKVEQGELISEMGSTGFSTGPHLHFEVHPGGASAANPIAFLPPKSR
jgi:murein DD-endopeptidase MepM/ murein hydrolase activator NlpD